MRKTLLLTFALIAGVALHQHDARLSTPLYAQAGANVVVNPNTYQDLRWRSIGPHRGGRSTAAAGVRTQPNVFYMGATGGGVWKTENYGVTWTPISDGQIATGSIGAIDVSDSNPNVIYVGTGSEAIRSNVILGRGVYKSTDAGKTWQFSGLRDVGQIGQVKIHPKNPDIAYVAALGNPFGWGPERGVFRTKDGGKTWQKVLFINDQTGVVSVAINWSNPNEIYAGAWRASAQAVDDHQRRPGGRRRRLQDDRRRRPLDARQQRVPRRSDRQGLGGHRAVEPEGGLRAGRGEGRQGRPVSLGGQRRDVDAREQRAVASARARSTSTRCSSTRRTRTKSTSRRWRSSARPTAAGRSPPSRRPTATITSSGSIPTTRRFSSRPTTAARTSRWTTARAGRRR